VNIVKEDIMKKKPMKDGKKPMKRGKY